MSKLSKKWPYVLGAAVIFTLASATVVQSGLIQKWKYRAVKAEKELYLANGDLADRDATIERLRHELGMSRDSVASLSSEILGLQSKIEEQKKTIEKLSGAMRKHQEHIVHLTAEIERTKIKNADNELKIKELYAEIDHLLKENERLDELRTRAVADNRSDENRSKQKQDEASEISTRMAETEAMLDADTTAAGPVALPPPSPIILNAKPSSDPQPLEPGTAGSTDAEPSDMKIAIQTSKQEMLNKIMTGTVANFSSVVLKSNENGSELRKTTGNDWRYTFVDLNLENSEPEVLLDQFFELQIIDLDQKTVVPMNEGNRQFPESEQGNLGYRFKYSGKPVSIRYYNTEEKIGKNFALQLKYAGKKLVFKIPGGALQIVENGNVMSR